MTITQEKFNILSWNFVQLLIVIIAIYDKKSPKSIVSFISCRYDKEPEKC